MDDPIRSLVHIRALNKNPKISFVVFCFGLRVIIKEIAHKEVDGFLRKLGVEPHVHKKIFSIFCGGFDGGVGFRGSGWGFLSI